METPSPKGDSTPQRPNRRKSKAKVHRATDRLVGQVYAAQVQRNVEFFNFKDIFFNFIFSRVWLIMLMTTWSKPPVGNWGRLWTSLLGPSTRPLKHSSNENHPVRSLTIPINLLSILFFQIFKSNQFNQTALVSLSEVKSNTPRGHKTLLGTCVLLSPIFDHHVSH